MSDSKLHHLHESRTLNPHPESVTDPSFSNSSFFDSRDLLQVRYEMIRFHTKDTTLKETAARFGMSTATCTRLKRDYLNGGLHALIPKRRGPRGPRKITSAVVDYARAYLAEHGDTSIRELAERVGEHFGISIHFSALHRALSKKKLLNRSGIGKDGRWSDRYDHWRAHWLEGMHSQAISLVVRQGVARALVLTDALPPLIQAKSPDAVDDPSFLLAHAALMSCSLIHKTSTKDAINF